MVAKRLKIPRVQVFGVATFFKGIQSKTQRQTADTCVYGYCLPTSGVQEWSWKNWNASWGSKLGDTTADNEYTLETVNCVGACGLGPVVVKNEEYRGQMTPIKVREPAWFKKDLRVSSLKLSSEKRT
ncbi:MAG: bidirectional hydrogenase complex protein HoxE [Candidatus Methanoperedens nitroreducens]|uniref:Bidirectional hydrogenase complex protein HoxE n=1 Tax=Candidatus Methanoperedens nitratireducens TaxID=1392998 RepID=A0A0P8CFU4_9EURY|nr:MAG: bidirectional hydrogenase complex protein HoxE [Candidatus Methanoperedens sp. BLZ1]